MNLKTILRWLGVLAAIGALITAVVGLESVSRPTVNPLGALALGVASLALLRAAEKD